MCSTRRCAARGPYLQQLHLAEGGPLHTQPCAHLAQPAGQQEQQPVERRKSNQVHSWWGLGVSCRGWIIWRPPTDPCPLPSAAYPTPSASPRVFLHPGLGGCGTPEAHWAPPSSSLCKPSRTRLCPGVMASGAAGRNPTSGFLTQHPLALSLRHQ